MANASTGIVNRPPGTTSLQITITNNTNTLVYQTSYLYDYTNNVGTLINVKNYFVQPNSTTTFTFLLVNTVYGESYSIDTYEVIYGPITPGVTVTFTNF